MKYCKYCEEADCNMKWENNIIDVAPANKCGECTVQCRNCERCGCDSPNKE